MNSKLARQPDGNSIYEKQNVHVNGESGSEQKEANILKKQNLTTLEKILEKDATFNTFTLVVFLLFIGFAYKLCCGKVTRDRRIIQGRGTGSSVLAGGSKKALRISSLKSNHRYGMNVPKLDIPSHQDSQSSSDDDY